VSDKADPPRRSSEKLGRCQLGLSRDNIYSDTLANEQPSYWIIIFLYIETDTLDIIYTSPYPEEMPASRRDIVTHSSCPSRDSPLSLSLSAFLFFTHYESIDHSKRANFPRAKFALRRSIRDTLFADSLVPFSPQKFHDFVAKCHVEDQFLRSLQSESFLRASMEIRSRTRRVYRIASSRDSPLSLSLSLLPFPSLSSRVQ